MGQSLVQNYVHIIFSTKYRQNFITPAIEPELHSYIAEICKRMHSPALLVGGYTDHIHILCRLSQKIALMDLMEELKSHSSKWIKTRGKEFESFYWQRGYGAFSISSKEVSLLKEHIADQHTYHESKTYQAEYRAFLSRYNVDYDERYVWD